MALAPKKSPRPKANPKSGAPTSSPRPKTRSDYEIEHAVGSSVKYQKSGGKMKKMATGGMCRGMGAAKKGGKYAKNG